MRTGARGARRRQGPEARQDGRRHEFHFAGRDKGFRQHGVDVFEGGRPGFVFAADPSVVADLVEPAEEEIIDGLARPRLVAAGIVGRRERGNRLLLRRCGCGDGSRRRQSRNPRNRRSRALRHLRMRVRDRDLVRNLSLRLTSVDAAVQDAGEARTTLPSRKSAMIGLIKSGRVSGAIWPPVAISRNVQCGCARRNSSTASRIERLVAGS